MNNPESFMIEALKQARHAASQGEVPVGAVLVHQGRIIGRAHNERESKQDPLAHAELKLICKASKLLDNFRLTGMSLFVTLEPCPMCLGALLQARVGQLYYGCPDPKRTSPLSGGELSYSFRSIAGLEELVGNNHRVAIRGPVLEEACAALLRDFFRSRR